MSSEDIQIMGTDEEKDERFDGVVLLEHSADEKTTAEDCGLWWYIRSWELTTFDGNTYWRARGGSGISKDIIKQLGAL